MVFRQPQKRTYDNIFLEDVKEAPTKYEKTSNPEEWKYVERVLPALTVPEPVQRDVYPSGWQPPAANLETRNYIVARTRNHMMPVYLEAKRRGFQKRTIIRKVEGDIWLLEQQLRAFLEDQCRPKLVRIQVDEFARKIRIQGDYVNAVKWWLGEKKL